jgi:hypothetical protein
LPLLPEKYGSSFKLNILNMAASFDPDKPRCPVTDVPTRRTVGEVATWPGWPIHRTFPDTVDVFKLSSREKDLSASMKAVHSFLRGKGISKLLFRGNRHWSCLRFNLQLGYHPYTHFGGEFSFGVYFCYAFEDAVPHASRKGVIAIHDWDDGVGDLSIRELEGEDWSKTVETNIRWFEVPAMRTHEEHPHQRLITFAEGEIVV